jgi:hypothetical protein
MTRAVDRLSSRIEDLPEGTLRRRVLESARRFKSSWVELARLLSQVRSEELWREWGYASFERYCSEELFLRRQTAEKLTRSYGFLERHEPQVARDREGRAVPAFEVIEVLSRAEAAGRLSEEGYRDLRGGVLEGGATRAAVSRALDARFGPAERPEPPAPEARLQRLAVQARRLAEACGEEESVPAAVTQRAEALADALERLAGRG